ncbi:helix-turn-helix transcriptional regulator [Sulfurimonas sp. SAG-AH-194-L11]|nr:helix-turn-helix transcriptional regulator [Sulfurimonas sp. SAG-AH-194-L11]MDF1877805.1 helix-turn-helix transcriptional regulator [Sulfurimonas sp. SAG-AH-194-L11]
MNNDLKNNYGFMTSDEIAKSLAIKIKVLRKKKFKTQKEFAQHIGMSHGAYARYEKTGQISFSRFIDIVKGINRIDEIAALFDEKKKTITW